MKERTEAYFHEYMQIKEGDWTLVISKNEKHLYEENDKN